MPEQVQDFYPTPSTISTCMYYTGLDPRTLKEVYVPKSPHEKAMQRALIQYRNPKNYDLVVEALRKADRLDLIGFDKKCLVRPRQFAKEKQWVSKEKQDKNKSGAGRSTEKKGQSRSINGKTMKIDGFHDKSAKNQNKKDYKPDSKTKIKNSMSDARGTRKSGTNSGMNHSSKQNKRGR
jgi:hypothetical protein